MSFSSSSSSSSSSSGFKYLNTKRIVGFQGQFEHQSSHKFEQSCQDHPTHIDTFPVLNKLELDCDSDQDSHINYNSVSPEDKRRLEMMINVENQKKELLRLRRRI
jgi:hypothetical protein